MAALTQRRNKTYSTSQRPFDLVWALCTCVIRDWIFINFTKQTCGTGSVSGSWQFDIGFPASVGASGGIMAVIPGIGVCFLFCSYDADIWSRDLPPFRPPWDPDWLVFVEEFSYTPYQENSAFIRFRRCNCFNILLSTLLVRSIVTSSLNWAI